MESLESRSQGVKQEKLRGCRPMRQKYHSLVFLACALIKPSNSLKGLRPQPLSSTFSPLGSSSMTGTHNREELVAKGAELRERIKNKELTPVRVFTSTELRKKLRLSGREKKSKLYLPSADRGNLDVLSAALRGTLPVAEVPYILRVKCATEEKTQITTSEDLQQAFSWAEGAGVDLHLYVEADPTVAEPLPPPWLIDLPDPMESPFWQMVSFYRFASIEDPDNMAGMLQALWRPLEVRGRVYVAKEGINAQMAVPVNVMERFEQATESVPQLNGVFLNKDTQWSKEEFFKGEEKSKRDGQGSPFRRLHVRSRYQIVADGFSEEDALELNANNGTGLTPEEWHEMVDREDTIVLDCRNAYESDVGIFDTAKPLDTAFFRDSWEKLDDILKDTPKDAPVMTYCTGGIRCVKIAAFLEQERGYTNVTRLEGGIISYNKYTKGRGLPSKFAGVNYVFDNRMAERITDDVLTVCEQCNEPWDRHVNCSNDVCHCRFIQCPKCAAKHSGACCNGCSAAVAAENAGEEPPKLWIQPQPFQNSFLNRMLWNVYEELGCASPSSHSTAAEEESAISMITSLGGATRVLVVGDASAAEPIKAELGSDGISIVTVGRDEVAAHLEAMEGEGGDILKDQRQDVIILMDTGGSEMTETVYRLLIEKKALKRQGLLMAPKTTLEGFPTLEKAVIADGQLLEKATLAVGDQGLFVVRYKG